MKKLLLTPIAYVLIKLFDCEVWWFTGEHNKLGLKIYKKFKF